MMLLPCGRCYAIGFFFFFFFFEADVITSIDMADVNACLFMADVIAIEADVITSIDKADVIA